MSEAVFPILNSAILKRQNEADRHLPLWLANPVQFPGSNPSENAQPIDEFKDYLDEDMIVYLKKMNIDNLFPVQRFLIPSLTLQFRSRMYRRPNDICVSSPTGSGKTLAFAIPIVNHLKKSLSRTLSALVILPSRDLAQQVYKAFHQLCQPTHLRCAIVASENETGHANNNLFVKLHRQESHTSINHGSQIHQKVSDRDEYVSSVNILISTPGVLIDLMHNCPGFSLKDLEILVIDEADRLMANHKHDWLNAIERSVFYDIKDCPCKEDGQEQIEDNSEIRKKQRLCFSSITGCSIYNSRLSKPIHKLLFSATLSSDPQLLMQMNLFQPRLFLASKPSITNTKIRHSLGSNTSSPCGSPLPGSQLARVNLRNELLTSSAIPDQLDEKMFITEPKEKLFIMWYLFHELAYKKAICFCNQLPTGRKLSMFLNEIHGIRAVEFSSNPKPETRQKYLNEFKSGKLDVIVCTDLMARGMDVEGVEYVISYDLPSSEIYYVHRVGRTARAGKKGTAITLVDTKQLVQFKRIVQLAHKKPHSMRLSDVVEEMKVPHSIKKNSEKYDMYTKTLGDYEDRLYHRRPKVKHEPKKE